MARAVLFAGALASCADVGEDLEDEQASELELESTLQAASMSKHVPYGRSNPILYSNDHPEDVHTDVIMMAMHSNGTIDLRGIITDQSALSGCEGDSCHTNAIDDAKRKDWIRAARASGFRDIPTSVYGEAAVRLILDEAREASVEEPLVIIVGGHFTAIAEAYRRDNSIAKKVIVSMAAFVWSETKRRFVEETNVWGDRAAAKIVMEKFRCVIVPFIDFNKRKIDETRFPSTPRSRVAALPNEPLRALMLSIYWYPWAHYDADGGPVATLLSSQYATASKRVRWASEGGKAYLADDSNSNDILITGVNAPPATDVWWREVKEAFAR